MNYRSTLGRACCVAAMALLAPTGPAAAQDRAAGGGYDILLSNDDGVNTANILALAETLKEMGNRVVISTPCRNSSGSGALAIFYKPLGPLQTDCRDGAVKAGAAGVGPVDPADPTVHYVDGSPVMSLVYGVEVVAPAIWGKGPDLVISGPNEGYNTGLVTPSSGTVANAAHALQRRIPAIAISADSSTRGDEAAAAAVAAALKPILEKILSAEGPMPGSIGLSINVPKFDPAGPAPTPEYTVVGRGTKYLLNFVPDLSQHEIGRKYAKESAPGFVLTPFPPDSDDEEAAAIARGHISVSLIQGGFDAEADTAGDIAAWKERLKPVFE
ncbi:MAG: 5'/3'-nucleotidase SurE [Pikeienuella sp.]